MVRPAEKRLISFYLLFFPSRRVMAMDWIGLDWIALTCLAPAQDEQLRHDLVGSWAFMAPEVLQRAHHPQACDL